MAKLTEFYFKAPNYLLAEIGCLAASTVFYFLGIGSAVLVFVVVALWCAYVRTRACYSRIDWMLHPNRVLIPLSVAFQFIYWLWFGLFAEIRPASDFDWMLPEINRYSMAGQLGLYLLIHVPLFFGVDVGFKLLRWKWTENVLNTANIKSGRVLILSVITIVISILGGTGLLIGSNVLAYLNSSFYRVYPTIIGLLAFLACSPTQTGLPKRVAAILLGLGLIAGFALSFQTGMRIWLFHQILILLSVALGVALLFNRRKIALRMALIVSISFVLFGALSAIKFQTDSDFGVAAKFQFAAERGLQRLAPFTTDGVIEEYQIVESLGITPENTLARMVSAVPLFGSVFSSVLTKDVSLEQRIYRYVSKDWRASDVASVFISGASESIYAFGPAIGIVAIFCGGLLQGLAVSLAAKISGYLNWINVTSQYILISLLGMDIMNFIRLPVNVLLGSFVLYFLVQSNGTNVHRVISQRYVK